MSVFSRRPLSIAADMARPCCSQCRGPIQWCSALDLAWTVHVSERTRVWHLIGFTGQDADAWYCPYCGCWGIFDGGVV